MPSVTERGPALPALRSEVEIVDGFDGSRLLFLSSSGRYVRLGAGALTVAGLLDGRRTADEVRAAVATTLGRPLSEEQIGLLVRDLTRVGALEVAADPEAPSRRLPTTPTKLVPLLKAEALQRLVQPFALSVRALGVGPLTICIAQLVVILAGAGAGIAALMTASAPPRPDSVVAGMLLFWAGVVVHEFSHAVMCAALWYPARSMGIAFWYYFIPIAYVDRTDTYRVRERSARVAISLAGPAADMAGVLCASALLLSALVEPFSPLGRVLSVFLVFGVISLIGNVNPLLPTDGQQALESAFGKLNVRNRAMSYVLEILGFSRAAGQKRRSGAERAGLMAYGILCFAYVAFVAVFLLISIARVMWSLLG